LSLRRPKAHGAIQVAVSRDERLATDVGVMHAFEFSLPRQEINNSLFTAKVLGTELAARRDPHALPGFCEIDHSLTPRYRDFIWAFQNVPFARSMHAVKRVFTVTFDKVCPVHFECINEVLCPHLEPF
jgi:hypothetical protein